MPNPDMVTQYLASRGAAPSASNANMVRQHFAANPDNLDRRAMGLPGGLDDSSAVLDAMLDKHIAESMPVPQGSVEVGQPVKAESVPPPSKTAPAPRGPTEVGGTASRQGDYGPGAAPSRQGEYSAPTSEPTGVTGDLTGSSYASGSQIGPTQQSDLTKWLIGLLGGGGALYGLSKMVPNGASSATPNRPLPGTTPPNSAPNARTPAPYAEGTPVTPGNPQGSTGVPVTENDPDAATRRARMEAEIAAENDAMQRQMEQEALTRKRQSNTEELLRAGRRATGRR